MSGSKMISNQQVTDPDFVEKTESNSSELKEENGSELAGENKFDTGAFAVCSHRKAFGVTHGAHTTHFRKRYGDGRTTEGRFLRAIENGLIEDLGGLENISTGQKLILGRIREKIRIMKCIGDYVDKQPNIVQKDGEILPCLGKNYVTYSESLRRDLQFIYELANKKPSKIPDLDDYIKKAKTIEAGSGE